MDIFKDNRHVSGESSLDVPNGLKQLVCELEGARARAPVRAPPSSHSTQCFESIWYFFEKLYSAICTGFWLVEAF
jgi:hypothetical protein